MVALTSSAMATFSFTPHQSSLSPPLLQNQSSLFSTSSSSSSTTTNSYRKNSYGLPSMSISNTHYSTIHHHYHEDGNLGNRMPRELYAPRCYAPSEKNHRSVRTRVTDITGSSPSPSPSSSSSSSSGSDGEAIASSFASNAPVARLVAQRSQSITVHELDRPLAEYMSLPASQYSVLDAERIERVDDNTFRCYVYRFSFFNFEVCPVLLVKVDERPNGCCIRLLSCTLEGSPIVVAQNKKFSASMVNTVSWSYSKESSTNRKLESDTTIEVVIEIPGAFRAIPAGLIESTGKQILSQLLGVMLPRFLAQLEKDYRAWASGDSSRRPLGTGEI